MCNKEKGFERTRQNPSNFSVTSRLLLATLIFVISSAQLQSAELSKCLYVSSYHKGYDWSDALEEGIRNTLAGKCEILQFDMDTKRKQSVEEKELAARKVLAIIDKWQPDVVITSDDNAAKYLIVPYFKNSSTPFVFSGVNWTVKEYGFPFDNVTGIVEVAPIEPMLKEAARVSEGKRAIYLGANTLTERKNFDRIAKGAEKLGISLKMSLVSEFDTWVSEFENSQSMDFLVIGSNSGISGWDEEAARELASRKTRVISVTNHEWMMGVTALGYTKIPQEHGEWAAEVALAVLDGVPINEIPIVTNRKWDLWLNQDVANATCKKIPIMFSRYAKQVSSLEQVASK
ncbi:MAG: ABC transporter substrate-binding protein [Granulosicoccus sp.]